jgi:hypothetical protein
MPRIDDLFKLHTARSVGFERYTDGDVAYITNDLRDNGIVGYVKPKPNDKVFKFVGISVSAFCEAAVQIPTFVARGNGGSGLIVLEPKVPLTADQLGFFAAYINTFVRWRFSWYRQASVQRIRRLQIPDAHAAHGRFAVRELLPGSLNQVDTHSPE